MFQEKFGDVSSHSTSKPAMSILRSETAQNRVRVSMIPCSSIQFLMTSLIAASFFCTLPISVVAQIEETQLPNRSLKLRFLPRYPAIYAETQVAVLQTRSPCYSNPDGKAPLLALVTLLRKRPEERLFTLDWQMTGGKALFRVHFDRKRKLLWFASTGLNASGKEIDDSEVFSDVTFAKLSKLSRKPSLPESKITPRRRSNSRSDTFFRPWFDLLLRFKCRRLHLSLPERPNFGSRQDLFANIP